MIWAGVLQKLIGGQVYFKNNTTFLTLIYLLAHFQKEVISLSHSKTSVVSETVILNLHTFEGKGDFQFDKPMEWLKWKECFPKKRTIVTLTMHISIKKSPINTCNGE